MKYVLMDEKAVHRIADVTSINLEIDLNKGALKSRADLYRVISESLRLWLASGEPKQADFPSA